jgi:hypothetical protein
MKEKERSCVRCNKWFRCSKIENAEDIWKLRPEERDLKWYELAFDCPDFE